MTDEDDHCHDHSHSHSHSHSNSNTNHSDQHQEHQQTRGTTTSASHHDHHNHHDEHDDDPQKEVLRRLKLAMLLCGSFLIVEVIGGYFSGSLAVLSDAAHLFADLASFAVAIAAAHLAALPTTDQHTFGLKRAESLAALLSMISLALVSIYLAVEAIRRFVNREHDQVDGKLMSQVAAIGVLVNIALALVLGVENHIHLPGADHDHSHDHGHSCGGHGHEPSTTSSKSATAVDTSTTDCDHDHGHEHGHEETALLSNKDAPTTSYTPIHADELVPSDHGQQQAKKAPLRNINLQAAYLHVVGDLLQSLGVLVAGIAIWINPKWTVVDPICTLLFCAVVFYSTLGVLRHSVAVLLQEVPPDLSWKRVYAAIQDVPGVENIHDLHVWSISHGDPALAVHCSCNESLSPEDAMQSISTVLKGMGIHHITIQIQRGQGECITCQGAGCDTARIDVFQQESLARASENNGGSIIV